MINKTFNFKIKLINKESDKFHQISEEENLKQEIANLLNDKKYRFVIFDDLALSFYGDKNIIKEGQQ